MTNSRAAASLIFAHKTKAADQQVTSSETQVNDNTLFITCKANKIYLMRLLIFQNSQATPDMDINLTLPSGATAIWNTGVALGKTGSTMADVTTEVMLAGTGGSKTHLFYIQVVMSSTAGNVQLQFAQDTSDAGATIMKRGSSLTAWEA